MRVRMGSLTGSKGGAFFYIVLLSPGILRYLPDVEMNGNGRMSG